jgi:hypothetical protein
MTIERRGLAEEVDGSRNAAGLKGDEAQQVKGGKELRIKQQGVAAEPLDLIQLSGLKVLHRRRKEIAGWRAERGRRTRRGPALALPASPPAAPSGSCRGQDLRPAPPKAWRPAP